MNTLIELWHHLRRQHYPTMQTAISASRLAKMHGHRGRVENCTICGEWQYIAYKK
jgi:hypothetical protein